MRNGLCSAGFRVLMGPGYSRNLDTVENKRAAWPVVASEKLQNDKQTQEGARDYKLPKKEMHKFL